MSEESKDAVGRGNLWERAMAFVQAAAPLKVTVHVYDSVPDWEIQRETLVAVRVNERTWNELKRLTAERTYHEQPKVNP